MNNQSESNQDQQNRLLADYLARQEAINK